MKFSFRLLCMCHYEMSCWKMTSGGPEEDFLDGFDGYQELLEDFAKAEVMKDFNDVVQMATKEDGLQYKAKRCRHGEHTCLFYFLEMLL